MLFNDVQAISPVPLLPKDTLFGYRYGGWHLSFLATLSFKDELQPVLHYKIFSGISSFIFPKNTQQKTSKPIFSKFSFKFFIHLT